MLHEAFRTPRYGENMQRAHTERPRAGTQLLTVLTAVPFYPQSWHLKTHLRVAAPLDTGGNWNPGSADLCWLASKKQC